LPESWSTCTTDSNGTVTVVFTTPTVLPNGGTATVAASPVLPQTGASAPIVTTSYTYESLTVSGIAATAVEGGAFSGVVATVTGQNLPTGPQFSAQIAWGDGSAGIGTVTPTPAGWQVTGSHTYAEESSPGTVGY